MKKLVFRYDGKTQKFDESTHAALFHKFFDWWKTNDLATTFSAVTKGSGLRLDTVDTYERNVIKKKNLEIVPGCYIITHITPAAMDKGLINFLKYVDAEIIEPKISEKPKKSAPKKIEPKDDSEADDDENEDEIEKLTDFEVEKLALKLANTDFKTKNGKKVVENIQEIIKRAMTERDASIKERLSRGNRTENV